MAAGTDRSWLDGLTDAHRAFVQKIYESRNFPRLLAGFAATLVTRSLGSPEMHSMASMARKALELGQDDAEVRRLTSWFIRKEAPLWHFSILQDDQRNRVYRRGIEKAIQPDSVVLEVGTGSGVLAMMAARAGAQHVYTCEASSIVAEIARKNIEKNGLSNRITVINKSSFDLRQETDFEHRPNVLISELIDSRLLGEDVLQVVDDARLRLLDPDAIVLPCRIAAMGALVGGSNWLGKYRIDMVEGFDLSAINQLAPDQFSINCKDLSVATQALSAPITLLEFDLANSPAFCPAVRQLEVKASIDGLVEAILVWLRLDLGHEQVFENAPPTQSSWQPTVYRFPEARKVSRGDSILIEAAHDLKTMKVKMV